MGELVNKNSCGCSKRLTRRLFTTPKRYNTIDLEGVMQFFLLLTLIHTCYGRLVIDNASTRRPFCTRDMHKDQTPCTKVYIFNFAKSIQLTKSSRLAQWQHLRQQHNIHYTTFTTHTTPKSTKLRCYHFGSRPQARSGEEKKANHTLDS